LLDSNNHAAGKDSDVCESNALGKIVLKPKAGDPSRTGDHAPKRFAKGRAPGPHGSEISRAGLWQAGWMRVEEAQHVVAKFLAAKCCAAVEADTGGFSPLVIDPSCVPDRPAVSADERPALLDSSIHGAGGCASQ
jgi:hypothetical protein